jgi:hypothetical protein
MAQAIRASLLASAMAATLVGRRASKAVSQGFAACNKLRVALERPDQERFLMVSVPDPKRQRIPRNCSRNRTSAAARGR